MSHKNSFWPTIWRSWSGCIQGGEDGNAEMVCHQEPITLLLWHILGLKLKAYLLLNGCKKWRAHVILFSEWRHLQAEHKVSVSGTASIKLHHDNRLNLVVRMGRAISLLSIPLIMLFLNVQKAFFAHHFANCYCSLHVQVVHIQVVFLGWLLLTLPLKEVCKNNRIPGNTPLTAQFPPLYNNSCISAHPSVRTASPTYRINMWSTYKVFADIKMSKHILIPSMKHGQPLF